MNASAIKESHHFYPLRFYVRFTESSYSVSQTATMLFDAVSLLKSGLRDEDYSWLKQSTRRRIARRSSALDRRSSVASAGLLQGRTLTSWPGVRDDLVNAGATWLDQQFVRDRNLPTSRGPHDLIPFVQGCLDLFSENAPISRTGQQPVSRSAPQANQPPEIVLGAMKWLPKPSLRTAVGLGAIAAMVMATRPRRRNGEGTAMETYRA